MTFKDLQNVINLQPDHNNDNPQLEKLRGKAFWFWGSALHEQKAKTHKGNCCFNHQIGLPRKDGKRYDLFDYERILYMALLKPGYLNSGAAHPMSKHNSNLQLSSKTQYSRDLVNVLYPFKEKHLWCKKSVGLGVSEFM